MRASRGDSVFVTGADGFLGSNVVRVLLERGHRVKALVEPGRSASAIGGLPVEIVRGRLHDFPMLCAAASGARAVIHTAAFVGYWPTRSQELKAVNVHGTRCVIEAALRARVRRFVHVGSASSFRPGTLEQPGDESEFVKRRGEPNDYIGSKLRGQQEVLRAIERRGLPAIVVNPTFMLGPFGSPSGSNALLLSLYRGRIRGWPPGGKNFVHVRDAAAAIVNSLQHGCVGESYILGHQNLPYRQAFALFCDVMRVPFHAHRRIASPVLLASGAAGSLWGTLRRAKPPITLAAARLACQGWYYSARKAVQDLALPQTPVESAVEDALAWFRETRVVAAG